MTFRRSWKLVLVDGALLRAASKYFDVLITVDRNLPFQQNISSLRIGILILVGTGITYADLQPLVPKLLERLPTLQPGEVHRISS